MSEQYRTKLGLPPSSSKQQKESPRTQSGQSQHHNQHRTAVSNKIIPNQKVIKNKIQIDSSSMNASSDENISNLMKYYKSLDVVSHYVEKFMAVVNGLSLFKSSFITHEISKASTLSTNILKLNKNIDTRNKLVKLLQQYNTYLELNQKHSKEMLNEIKLIISDVRVVSINIVMLIKKIRKQYAYDALCGKFQKEFINKDRMYLRTMLSDLAFLKGSVIGNEFQLGNDFDTFFTKLRMDVPYTTDRMGSMITACQKYLIKEKVNMLLYDDTWEDGSGAKCKEDDRCKDKRNVVERCCNVSYGAVKTNNQSDIKKMKVNSNSKFNNLFVLYDNEFSILRTTTVKKSKHVVNKYKVSKSSFEIARMIKQVSSPSQQQQQQQQQVQLVQDNNNNSNNIEYKYILLSGKLSQIQNEYSEYYNSIPSQIKTGFNINDNLNNYLTGVFPRFIKVVNNSNTTMIGFITVSYFEANKLSITSISCNKENESHFSKFLIDVISYLKTTFTFKELYIELYYEKQGNDFILIKPLETSIKKEANFRWVSMVNDTTQRKIKYKIINNNFNPNQLNLLSNGHVLSINSLGLIEMGVTSNNNNEEQKQDEQMVHQEAPNDNDNGNDDGDSLGGEEYVENAHVEPLSSKDEEKINVFPVYSLLNEMMLNGEYNIDSETLRDINMESMQDMSNGIISNYIQLNRDQINEKTPLLKDMFIHKSTFNNNTNALYCGTVMNVHLFFDNVFTVKLDNNKIYNCISTQIGKLVYEGDNDNVNDKDEFYLLKTKNEKISLLLYENNSKSKLSSYFDNNVINTKSLCEYINEIYPQMETLSSENENISSIYLPQITINTSCNYESPRILNEFTIASSSSEEPENMMYYNIKQYEQNDRVIFNFDEQTTKTEQLYIELDTNEIPLAKKIQKDFIIAVINYDTLSEFNYPCIAAYIIKI